MKGWLAALAWVLAGCAAGPGAAPERLICAVEGAGDDVPDTAAIQAAIDACAGRGGKVVLGPGVWLSGGLRLGSDMELHLAAGAVLRLIPDMALYPAIRGPGEASGEETLQAALYAPNAERLVISGPGVIDGQGPKFWDPDFYALGLARPTLPRPQPTLELADCRDVTIRDLRLENLPGYAIRFHRCEGGRAEGVTIRNDPRSPNTDGIQIRDSSRITITGADIATGDDAIVLKSRERPVADILVEHSVLESDDAALKFGTGSAIGVKNSVFRDLTIRNSRYGVAIFQIDGGVHADNRFERISIHTGGRHPRSYPIFIDIDRRTAERGWGGVERHLFRDIAIDTTGAVLIAGNANAPIRALRLENVRFSGRAPLFDLAASSGKPRGNVTIRPQAGSVDFGRENAHVTLAHVEGLGISGLDIAHGDATRPRDGLALISVTGAELNAIALTGAGAGQTITRR
jgi:hypothetical protein